MGSLLMRALELVEAAVVCSVPLGDLLVKADFSEPTPFADMVYFAKPFMQFEKFYYISNGIVLL